ncbi:uncharacterized protein [Diabrotica undecimpunctata]|uniref:uncharacterized protein n=1 Tax=Diabrotica undecimpunctata TaxID=50387 RepID=UPI003B6388E1
MAWQLLKEIKGNSKNQAEFSHDHRTDSHKNKDRKLTTPVDEVKQAIFQSPGNIPPELLVRNPQTIQAANQHVSKYINGELRTVISTIHKRELKKYYDVYRRISVLGTISRVYGQVIKNRIEEEYSDMEAEEQAGFRADRSTIHHLFTITQLMKKKTVRNQPIHLLYIDLRKVYDSVP